ncbi:MAG: hypothetical protein ABJB74_06160 [Gemmatimonas sp.]
MVVAEFLAAEELATADPTEVGHLTRNGPGIWGSQYRDWKRRDIFKVKELASHAYTRHVLYMSEHLQLAAVNVMHHLMILRESPKDSPKGDEARAEDALRESVAEFVRVAQHEVRDPESKAPSNFTRARNVDS